MLVSQVEATGLVQNLAPGDEREKGLRATLYTILMLIFMQNMEGGIAEGIWMLM